MDPELLHNYVYPCYNNCWLWSTVVYNISWYLPNPQIQQQRTFLDIPVDDRVVLELLYDLDVWKLLVPLLSQCNISRHLNHCTKWEHSMQAWRYRLFCCAIKINVSIIMFPLINSHIVLTEYDISTTDQYIMRVAWKIHKLIMKSLKYSIRNKTTTSMKFDVLLLRGIRISEKELLISFSGYAWNTLPI